jgi:pectinesterase
MMGIWTAVDGAGFMAQGITFENTAGPDGHQAVALRVDSDHSVFQSCSIVGFQDSLYTHALRQLFYNCSIEGTVDFIFGNAAAFFQNCNIIVRVGRPTAITSTLTAQVQNKNKLHVTCIHIMYTDDGHP